MDETLNVTLLIHTDGRFITLGSQQVKNESFIGDNASAE